MTADASVLAQGGNRLELVSLLKPVLFLQRQGGPAPERKRAAGSGGLSLRDQTRLGKEARRGATRHLPGVAQEAVLGQLNAG